MFNRFEPEVKLDTADVQKPQLVVTVPPDRVDVVRDALAKLAASSGSSPSAQEIILEALRAAAEQAYFWTQEWQEKERAADLDIAKGRVRTFDTIEDMIEFLDRQ